MNSNENSKVIVTADKAGNVIVKSQNNTEWGHIRVEQTRMVLEDNGFARRKTLSALIPGTIVDLKGFGWHAGQEVRGKIIVRESLKPFNKKDPERDYKIAGESGVVCSVNGQPIYRKHFYVFDEEAADTLVAHDNDEEIKEAYAEIASESTGEEGEGAGPDFNL